MMDEHILDLIPAYVLGCLDPGDTSRVESHLPQCDLCKEEWLGYQAVAYKLALTPSQVAPPARLKEAVLSATGRRDPVLPLTQPPLARAAVTAPRISLKKLLPVWGVASLVLVIGLGIANLLLWQQVHKLSQPGRIVLSDYQIVPLIGTSSHSNASGIFVITRDGLSGLLTVDGLQPLDSMHQYQLWLIEQGRRISGGVFCVTSQGEGSLKINSSRSLYAYNAFGITIEPAGGSPGPTGDKVLGGNL